MDCCLGESEAFVGTCRSSFILGRVCCVCGHGVPWTFPRLQERSIVCNVRSMYATCSKLVDTLGLRMVSIGQATCRWRLSTGFYVITVGCRKSKSRRRVRPTHGSCTRPQIGKVLTPPLKRINDRIAETNALLKDTCEQTTQ